MSAPLARRMDSIVWLSCGHCPGAQSTSAIISTVRRYPKSTQRIHCHECGTTATVNDVVTPYARTAHPSEGA